MTTYGKLTASLIAAWFVFALVASGLHLFSTGPNQPPLSLWVGRRNSAYIVPGLVRCIASVQAVRNELESCRSDRGSKLENTWFCVPCPCSLWHSPAVVSFACRMGRHHYWRYSATRRSHAGKSRPPQKFHCLAIAGNGGSGNSGNAERPCRCDRSSRSCCERDDRASHEPDSDFRRAAFHDLACDLHCPGSAVAGHGVLRNWAAAKSPFSLNRAVPWIELRNKPLGEKPGGSPHHSRARGDDREHSPATSREVKPSLYPNERSYFIARGRPKILSSILGYKFFVARIGHVAPSFGVSKLVFGHIHDEARNRTYRFIRPSARARFVLPLLVVSLPEQAELQTRSLPLPRVVRQTIHLVLFHTAAERETAITGQQNCRRA